MERKLSIVLLALMLATAWTGTAFAEATPYASIRFATFYSITDAKRGANDTEDLNFGLVTGNGTRFGVKFKAESLTGAVEINNVTQLRHAFGNYDFGTGVLLIGQTWLPYQIAGSTSVHRPGLGAAGDGSMYSWGAFGYRKPQMRVALKTGVYAALIANQTEDADVIDLPELAVGYIGTFGKTTLGLHGAYMEDDQDGNTEDCYLLAAEVNTKIGLAGFLARVFYGQNLANMIGTAGEGLKASTGEDRYEDFGGFAQVGYKLTDRLDLVGGLGYVRNEQTGGAGYNDRFVYFVNVPVKVAKGFTVLPEIAWYDNIENAAGTSEFDSLWIGAKWQFDL